MCPAYLGAKGADGGGRLHVGCRL